MSSTTSFLCARSSRTL
uniref:Uncharacterized protein n=1 Tax=Arundo donax TaxID=35708 RepID=A0A0A9FMB9_ARUDO